MSINLREKSLLLRVFDDFCSHFAVPLKQTHDGDLTDCAAPLNLARAHALVHEASLAAEGARHFVRANPVFAVRHHPHGGEPLVESERRVFKDRSDLDAELTPLVRALALPLVLRGKERHVITSARRADNAVRPAARDKVIEAVRRIREEYDCLLQCLWCFLLRHSEASLANQI